MVEPIAADDPDEWDVWDHWVVEAEAEQPVEG